MVLVPFGAVTLKLCPVKLVLLFCIKANSTFTTRLNWKAVGKGVTEDSDSNKQRSEDNR